MFRRRDIELKSSEQIELMRRAGLIVADALAAMAEAVAPGVRTKELDAVAEEVRRIFPGAVVARQRRRRRVVAAVPESPAVRPGVTALRARCAELVTSATPTVTVVDAPADAEVVQQLLRSTT